jgi:hypothetical protein
MRSLVSELRRRYQVNLLPIVVLVVVALLSEPMRIDAQTPISSGIRIRVENAGQVTSLASLGRGPVNALAWSPDGKTIAVASPTGTWLYVADDLQSNHVSWKVSATL